MTKTAMGKFCYGRPAPGKDDPVRDNGSLENHDHHRGFRHDDSNR